MVVLRLSRVGKKSHATWRLIASDKRKDTVGTYLELLGSYDPHRQPPAAQLNPDRIKHWLSIGAKPSPTVHNLLVDQGILPGPKLARKMVKSGETAAEAGQAGGSAGKPVDGGAAPATTPTAQTEAKPAAEAEVKETAPKAE